MSQWEAEIIEFVPATDDDVAIELSNDMFMLAEAIDAKEEQIKKYVRKMDKKQRQIDALKESLAEVDETLTNYLRGK